MNRTEMKDHFDDPPMTEIELSSSEWQTIIGSLILISKQVRQWIVQGNPPSDAQEVLGLTAKLEPFRTARRVTITLS